MRPQVQVLLPRPLFIKLLNFYIMKRLSQALCFSLLALTLTACSNPNNSDTIEPDTTDMTQIQADYPAGDYVGMSVPQAQAKAKAEGVPFRITMADGEAFAVTMDYRVGRINAIVQKGLVVSYNVEGEENSSEAQKKTYDQSSWQTMIPESCTSFFDGCNNCTRAEGSDNAACTRMFCETYKEPQCLDTNPDEMTASSRGKKVSYKCEAENEFMISYDEYVSGDAITKLKADQIMFSDRQTVTASILNRTVAASGEKYASENGLNFWSKGETAVVMQGETNLYENCETV